MKLEIDFSKLSKERREAVLNVLFDGTDELEEKYEKVLDKIVIARNENSDCSSLEAQKKLIKIYDNNQVLIDEHNEVTRLMEEVYKGENQKMKLEIEFDYLSEKRRKAILDALFDGMEEINKAYEEVYANMKIECLKRCEHGIGSEEAGERMRKLYDSNASMIIEHDELEKLYKVVDPFMYFGTKEKEK